jgi:predicted dehydrogenase
MFKAGIVGCGMIAGAYEKLKGPVTWTHGKAYRLDHQFGELGFVDTHAERAKRLAKKFSGKAYANVDAMLNGLRPDVVSVCVPNDQHFIVLKNILEHAHCPKVIFAEKPICSNRTELAALRGLERRSRAAILVNHTRRFDPAHRRLRDLVRSNSLGALLGGHVDYYGGFRHIGVHLVDLLLFLFERGVKAENLRYRCESRFPSDPTLDGLLKVDGATITLSGVPEKHYQLFEVSLLFEKGQIKLTDFGQRVDVLRKTVNAAKERVLVPDEKLSGTGLEKPMAEAVRVIAGFLKSKDRSLIKDFGLAEAAKTMDALWRGSKLYARNA